MLPPLAIAISATRWSISVWVMISPLTMAVALTTEGMEVPNTMGLAGRLSTLVLLVGWSCATAAPAAAMPSMTSAVSGPALEIVLITATPQIPFVGQSIAGRAVRCEPLNAGLAADPLQGESKREGPA